MAVTEILLPSEKIKTAKLLQCFAMSGTSPGWKPVYKTLTTTNVMYYRNHRYYQKIVKSRNQCRIRGKRKLRYFLAVFSRSPEIICWWYIILGVLLLVTFYRRTKGSLPKSLTMIYHWSPSLSFLRSNTSPETIFFHSFMLQNRREKASKTNYRSVVLQYAYWFGLQVFFSFLHNKCITLFKR